jgi:hypothetical protein
MTAILAITFWFLFLMLLYVKFREINPNHGVIPHGLGDLKVPLLPKKKVDTCQFCGRGIVPGFTLTNCPGCGAPITPLMASRVPRPGPSNPIFRTGMESNLWRKDFNNYECDELIGDNGVVLARVERYIDQGSGYPDDVDHRLLGKEKR